jgi:carbamoyltransferase
MTRPVYILGTGLSHDGSACLMKDGKILVAIEKERITRKKHDGGNDSAAMRYCLDAAGIDFGDVTLLVQNANFGMFEYGSGWLSGDRGLPKELPIVTISHHLAHAYGAFGTSPFDEADVAVIDGCGSSFDDCMDLGAAEIPERPVGEMTPLWNEKDSHYRAGDSSFTTLYKDFSPWGYGSKDYPLHPPTTRHSIGGVYAAASYYAFRGLEDAGKLMGLAPYGRAAVHDFPVFDLKDGRVFVRYDWMKRFETPARSFEEFKENFQHHADLAWWIQREVERALLYVLECRHAKWPAQNLCYSGGVALNAVANRRILREGPYRNLYIQPAAGDNGLAVGCAYYGWLKVLERGKRSHTGSVYLGKTYPREEAERVVRGYSALFEWAPTPDPVSAAADALAAGKVVGWFQGGAEFGPRALGNRSILADPRRADVRDFINAKVKFREDFRPFAPSVLAEDAAVYFDCDYASPHMLLVAPVRAEWRDKIPAVVHRDGSARIQTVSDENPTYRALLSAFKERTGLGLLLNTSLNRRGEPMVETPENALYLFANSALDLMILDGFVVSKPTDFEARLARFVRLSAQAQAKSTFNTVVASGQKDA